MARVRDAARPLAILDQSDDASRHVAVVPSDTIDLPQAARELYIGVTGDVTYIDSKNVSRLLKNAVQGSVVKGDFKRIMATGTAAQNLMAVY